MSKGMERAGISRGRDRAHPGPGPRRHPHRPSGHRHRPPRRRGRPHPRRPREADRQAGAAQHPRGQEPRGRRPARRAGCRRAALQPGLVPSRDAQVDADDDEGRRQGHPGAVRRPPRWRRDVALGVLPRGPGAPAHAARQHRLRLLRGPDDVRPDRREGLDLQGRRRAAASPSATPPRPLPGWPSVSVRPGPPARAATTARPTAAPPVAAAPSTSEATATEATVGAGGSAPSQRNGGLTMLIPRRVKHRKQHHPGRTGAAKGGTRVTFGDYGIQAIEPAYVTNRQIESARIAMTRHIKRGGKVWINIYPDRPLTKKPAETRMGSGKGSPEWWIANVKPGRVMFELSGVPEPIAKEAMRRAMHKLPMKCRFVRREEVLDEQRAEQARGPHALLGGRRARHQAAGGQGGAVQPPLPGGHRPAREPRPAQRRPQGHRPDLHDHARARARHQHRRDRRRPPHEREGRHEQ